MRTYDASTTRSAGATRADAVVSTGDDSLVWVAAILSVPGRLAPAVDFNADGKPDLFWQNTTSGDVYLWIMNGTTQAGGTYLAHGMGPWKVVGPK
jgi:hypothetical protein